MSNATAEQTMTPAQAEAQRDGALFTLGTATWFVNKVVGDLSGDQWVHQAFNGANHALWNVGHLAVSEKFFLQCAGGSTASVPDSYDGLFGMDTDPQPKLDAYPDPAQVLETFNKVRAEFTEHVKGLSGSQLAAPITHEQMQQVAPTVVNLINFMVLHDSTHAGQILMARKSLGLPRVLGS